MRVRVKESIAQFHAVSQKQVFVGALGGDHAGNTAYWSAHFCSVTDRVEFERNLPPSKSIGIVGARCYTEEDRRENRHCCEARSGMGPH